jgi:hypothetical protein
VTDHPSDYLDTLLARSRDLQKRMEALMLEGRVLMGELHAELTRAAGKEPQLPWLPPDSEDTPLD